MSGIELFTVTVSQIELLAVLTAKGVTVDTNGNLIIQEEKDSRIFTSDLWENFEVKRITSTAEDDT